MEKGLVEVIAVSLKGFDQPCKQLLTLLLPQVEGLCRKPFVSEFQLLLYRLKGRRLA